MQHLDNYLKRNIAAYTIEQGSVCNLQCVYCDINSRSKASRDLNKSILSNILNDTFLNRLYSLNPNLSALTLWGTEPTLNLPVFLKANFFNKAVEMFPNLRHIHLSTNLVNNFNKIRGMLEQIENAQQKFGRTINIDIQLSVDGDQEITDRNRGNGVSDQIIKTLKQLGEYYSSRVFTNIKVFHHFKPTFNQLDIKEFAECGADRLDKFYSFFDKLLQYLGTNKDVFVRRQVQPTLQLPNYYTNEDGTNFAILNRYLFEFMKHKKYQYVLPTNEYYIRFMRTLQTLHQINTEYTNRSYTCSAGVTNLGLLQNGSFAMCHQQFYFEHPEYLDNADQSTNVLGRQHIDGVKNSIKQAVQTTEFELTRALYQSQVNADFTNKQIQDIFSLTLSLQKFGGLSDKRLLTDLAYTQLFSTFIQSQFQCPISYLVHTGIMSMPSQSIIKIFGNGQFSELFNYTFCSTGGE